MQSVNDFLTAWNKQIVSCVKPEVRKGFLVDALRDVYQIENTQPEMVGEKLVEFVNQWYHQKFGA